MKTLMEIIFHDNTSETKWVSMDPKEAMDKLGRGKYALVYGRPKLIRESRALCWDIEGEAREYCEEKYIAQ